jgi:GT2 family glycosyltransferase
MPEASVIVLTHNSAEVLPSCLEGLRRQTLRDFEVIVVDNASSDGSAEIAERCYPEAVVVRSIVNTGYAGGCNAGFRRAAGGCLAVIGPDCEPEPDWLSALVRACREPGVGLATSMVRHQAARDRINACGNDVHVLGLGFCHGMDDPWEEHMRPTTVASISGCAFAMPRAVFDRVGGFDDVFFMYCEDTDLSLRVWLAGCQVVYEPGSVVYHRYRLDMRPDKFFHLERNRYLVLARNLSGKAAVWLFPALLAGEMMMWAYAALHGGAFLAAKARAWRWLISNRAAVRVRRARLTTLRRDGGGVPLDLLTARLSDSQILGSSALIRPLGLVVNAFFAATLAVARRFAG